MVSKGLMTVKDLWNGACSGRTDPAITEGQDMVSGCSSTMSYFSMGKKTCSSPLTH